MLITTPPDRPQYSINGAAAYHEVHPVTIRRLIRAGKLPARMIGGQYRIEAADVESLGKL